MASLFRRKWPTRFRVLLVISRIRTLFPLWILQQLCIVEAAGMHRDLSIKETLKLQKLGLWQSQWANVILWNRSYRNANKCICTSVLNKDFICPLLSLVELYWVFYLLGSTCSNLWMNFTIIPVEIIHDWVQRALFPSGTNQKQFEKNICRILPNDPRRTLSTARP